MMKQMKKFICALIGGIVTINQLNGVDKLQILPIQKHCQTSIAIGSTNPIKIQAIKNALNDETVLVVACTASSKVRLQPLSNEETLEGAINRARDCLEKTQSKMAIGLEAGVIFVDEQVYLCHWGAIVDRNQNVYYTNGPIILLPKEYSKPLLEGENLEDIMHRSTGIESLGAKEGAIGVFTQNRLNREQVLTQMVKVLLGEYYYYQLQAQ